MVEVDRLYPFKEAVPMMGMRITKAYDLVAKGRLSVVRNGGRTFVRSSEINRFINDLEAQPSGKNSPNPEQDAA